MFRPALKPGMSIAAWSSPGLEVPAIWPATLRVDSLQAPENFSPWFDGVDAPDGISVPEWWCCKPLEEASVNQVSTVGLDLAKHIFQVHGADSAGAVVFRQKLRRGQLLSFLATLPPCTVALEACGSALY